MRLDVAFAGNENTFDASFSGGGQEQLDATLSTSVPVMQETEYETYRGSYEVTPEVDKIVLETQDKVLKKDLTIKEIPVYEVSNSAGGETVIIGGNIKNYG